MYTSDIYYRQFPKMLQYTSAGIPIHHRPMRPSPNDPPRPRFRSLPFSTSSRPSSRRPSCRTSADGTGSARCGRSPNGWTGRPTVIPARWNSVRISVGQLHHARVGVTAKTLANHKSNVRAALRWFGKEHDVPQRGVRLSTEWARFRDRLDDRIRDRLYSLIRYCSARGIGPSSVDDKIFDEYWRYRTETTARASNNTARRFMVRAWNACAAAIDGWPLRRLTEPPLKVRAEPAWEDFPEGLRRDLDDYFAGLAKPHRSLNGKRIQPCCAGNDPDPPGRTCRDGAHGRSARRADREPDLIGRAPPPRCRRTGHRRLLAKEWR